MYLLYQQWSIENVLINRWQAVQVSLTSCETACNFKHHYVGFCLSGSEVELNKDAWVILVIDGWIGRSTGSYMCKHTACLCNSTHFVCQEIPMYNWLNNWINKQKHSASSLTVPSVTREMCFFYTVSLYYWVKTQAYSTVGIYFKSPLKKKNSKYFDLPERQLGQADTVRLRSSS